jgi:peroxiredoxin
MNHWRAVVPAKEDPAMPTEILVKDLREAFEQARALDGSMAERLDVFADATRKLHPSTAAIVDRLVARLKQNDAGKDAPDHGDAMPPFVLPDETGRLVSLKDLLAQGPAVVTFHRGHWCPYCRISISTLVKAQPRVEALGARMVAIVPDRAQFASELRDDCNVKFPILSDMDNGYAMSLNLAIWVGAEMQEYMSKIGRMLPQYQGNDSWMLPIPATFVVGKDGRIKARFVDPDYRKRMTIEELISALK